MALSREQIPELVRRLVEPEILLAAGYERHVDWLLPVDVWEGPEADALRAQSDQWWALR